MKRNEFKNYNEKIQRGHIGFPIQLYCVDKHSSQYVMPLHWHNELEIIKVYSGTLDLYINNIPYTMTAGDIAVINCTHLHRADPVDCKYDCIVCDLEKMIKTNTEIYDKYVSPLINGDLVINYIFNPDNTKLYFSLNSIFSILKNQFEYYQLNLLSNLYCIFEQLYCNNCISQIKVSKRITGQTHLIAELLEWIDNNYTEHITLDIISKKVGVTPNYLCRIFKAYTGKTPIEYVNFVRIRNICYEIEWGHKSITEIAIDNGYNDISYFCRVFKKYKGISAKKYSEMIG